jgi:hypothetical protein
LLPYAICHVYASYFGYILHLQMILMKEKSDCQIWLCLLRAFWFTRDNGKAGGAGGLAALLPGRGGIGTAASFSSAAEGGITGNTGKATSPGHCGCSGSR